MKAHEYGLLCNADDEARLVKNVNAFLTSLDYRKMYRKQPTGLRNPDRPDEEPRYSHYYCQFLRQHPRWYFDLYPNADLAGRRRFPEHPEAGWTLFVNYPGHEHDTPDDTAQLDRFRAQLVEATGFATMLLHAYGNGEDRR